jgi:hypothetical protein
VLEFVEKWPVSPPEIRALWFVAGNNVEIHGKVLNHIKPRYEGNVYFYGLRSPGDLAPEN